MILTTEVAHTVHGAQIDVGKQRWRIAAIEGGHVCYPGDTYVSHILGLPATFLAENVVL